MRDPSREYNLVFIVDFDGSVFTGKIIVDDRLPKTRVSSPEVAIFATPDVDMVIEFRAHAV